MADITRLVPQNALSRTALRAFVGMLTSAEPLSRRALAERLGVSAATITHAVEQLKQQGLVGKKERAQRTPGRGPKESLLEINAARGSVAGVSIRPGDDGQSVQLVGVLTGLDAVPLTPPGGVERTLEFRDPAPVVGAIADFVDQLRSDYVSSGPLMATGVTLGGVISDGRIDHSPNLHWRGFDLAQALGQLLGDVVVSVENDANALAVFSHWFGEGRGSRSLAAVILDDGIGTGLVLRHGLYHGSIGMAGEIGHLAVTPELFEPSAETSNQTVAELHRKRTLTKCSCGRMTGCTETFASRAHVVEYHRALAGRRPRRDWDLAQIVVAADEGDELAEQVVRRAGWAFGLALVSLLDVVDVPLILVHGRELAACRLFQTTVAGALRKAVFPSDPMIEHRIRYRALAVDDGARGAAAMALYDWLSDPSPVAVSA